MKKSRKQVRERRVVGYCRVSSEQQVERGMSLETQQARIGAFAVGEGLGEIDEFFQDRGVSAFKSRTSRRLGWVRMLDGLEAGDVIVAATLDRVFRSTSDFCSTVELLEKLGIDLYFVDKGLVTGENITNGLTLSILASVSQFESQLKAKRIQEVKSFQSANFIYSGGRRTRGFGREQIGGRKFMVANELEKQLLLFVAEAKKKRDAEMKRHDISRVKDRSEWSLKNIRKKLVEKIIAAGVTKQIKLDEEKEILGDYDFAGTVPGQLAVNRGNKVLLGKTQFEAAAERMAFSIATLHHMVSDDEKRNVFARLTRIKEVEKKIRLIDGQYVLAKDLASTSRRESSIDGGVGHKQMSLMTAGLRSRQKKDKVIVTRIVKKRIAASKTV